MADSDGVGYVTVDLLFPPQSVEDRLLCARPECNHARKRRRTGSRAGWSVGDVRPWDVTTPMQRLLAVKACRNVVVPNKVTTS